MAVYKALSAKAEIDIEVALLQAAAALDAAGVIAEGNRDVEGLLNVSAFWMKYGDALQEVTHVHAEEDMPGTKKFETGFQRSTPVEVEMEEEAEEEDD